MPVKRFFATFLTSPIFAWTWAGDSHVALSPNLQEIRPSDVGTALEMFAGRYLFAGTVVETEGVSPFSVLAPHEQWHDELNSFEWMRHFQSVENAEKHAFIQSLTLDWIGRNGVKNSKSWSPTIVSRRILSWLRHYRMLVENAPPKTVTLIDNSLRLQIEFLRARSGWTASAFENCFIRMALLGFILSRGQESELIDWAALELLDSLEVVFNKDGTPKSRNVSDLIQILLEIVPLRGSLYNTQSKHAAPLAESITKMLKMLRLLHHGDGSPIYFNGAGPVSVDILYALLGQENSLTVPARIDQPMGYARLSQERSLLVVDAATSPPLLHNHAAHAGLASFEFSAGADLIVCNVGAAPATHSEFSLGFRLASAHSSLMIDDLSIGEFSSDGAAGKFFSLPDFALEAQVNAEGSLITIDSDAYAEKFNIHHTRNLKLLAGGLALVGRDELSPASENTATRQRQFDIRFHLNVGAIVLRSDTPGAVIVKLANGAQWVFKWRGAEIRTEKSVRVTAIRGLQETVQIVLHGIFNKQHEIVWSFSKSAQPTKNV